MKFSAALAERDTWSSGERRGGDEGAPGDGKTRGETAYFARHQDLAPDERSLRERRAQFFMETETRLKRFDPRSPGFSEKMLDFLQQQFGNIRYVLRDSSLIPSFNDMQRSMVHANVSSAASRALRMATVYLWALVPMKVHLLRLKQATGDSELFEQNWEEEHQLLEELRFFSRDFKKSQTRPWSHSLCNTGWWKSPALADCAEHLLGTLRNSTAQGVLDVVPPAQCSFQSFMPDEVAAWHLLQSHCVADVMQHHLACAYTQLYMHRDLDEAASHLAVASLMALLCDGCRVDGLGFGQLALDEVLWRFGVAAYEALKLRSVRLEEDPQRYAIAAAAVAGSPPRHAWRSAHAAPLFGRTRCQAVLRPPICVVDATLSTGDFAAEAELIQRPLPTCHYERQKPTSTGPWLKPMTLEDAMDAFAGHGPAGCSTAPSDTILLLLPVHPVMLRHLTTEVIWLFGALAWFHGPTGRKLLSALWSAAGEHVHLGPPPPHLSRNSTEVLLVPSPGRPVDPERFLLKDLFSLLSDQPIRSLLPRRSECRCYRRGAVWGYLEAPFSGSGDFTHSDCAVMRNVVATHFGQGLRGASVQVLLVERCSKGTRCKRRVKNLDALEEALSEEAPVSLVRLHELPIWEQVRRVLATQVMVATFGATLAWIPLMKAGSFVIELHPGPPESLTLWGSCWTSPPSLSPEPRPASWDLNLRGEFGGWARTAHVHHACVATPATLNRRCQRSLNVKAWEVDDFEADVMERRGGDNLVTTAEGDATPRGSTRDQAKPKDREGVKYGTPGAMHSVEFFAGNCSLGTDVGDKSNFSLSSSFSENGTYALTAVAVDVDGNKAVSEPVLVHIGNRAPLVAFLSPAAGENIECGSIDFVANATDEDGSISEFFFGSASLHVLG